MNKKQFLVLLLIFKNKTFIIYIISIFNKYLNFINIFLSNSKVKLLIYYNIINYFTNLIDNKSFFYNLIYILKLINLKILKIFIKNN